MENQTIAKTANHSGTSEPESYRELCDLYREPAIVGEVERVINGQTVRVKLCSPGIAHGAFLGAIPELRPRRIPQAE